MSQSVQCCIFQRAAEVEEMEARVDFMKISDFDDLGLKEFSTTENVYPTNARVFSFSFFFLLHWCTL